ncbi:WD repeat-containing protein 43 [Sergentomyia squamirostris]
MNQHAGSFSPDSKYFANISDDGKIRVWDVETNELKHDYSTNIVNESTCKCFTWVTLKHGTGKKSRRSASGQEFLALGTSNGSVLVFSISTGKVEHSLKGNGHMGEISGICNNNLKTLYTCGRDKRVLVWDLEKGTRSDDWETPKESPDCICVTTSGKVITASRQVKIWHPDKHQCVHTFTGHPSAVTQLKYLTSGNLSGDEESVEYVLSASKTILMWNLSSKKKESAATFLVDDLVISLDAVIREETLQIAAATRSGQIHLYHESLETILKSTKPTKSMWRIKVVSDDKKSIEPLPIASVNYTNSGKSLLIAYGGAGCLKFESIDTKRVDSEEILIRDDPRKVKTTRETSTKHSLVDHTMVDYVLGGEMRKSLKMSEIPMEKRLENLTPSKDQSIVPTKNTRFLQQALDSRDPRILQDVLLTKDKKIIQTTLQYLEPQYIRPLIAELTLMMQKKIKNVECATLWMRLLIESKVGQLMANGSEDLRQQLAPFLGIVEHRVANLQTLTRVRGRLDLILSQINSKKDVNREEIAKINKNVIVHQDQGSDSDSDILNDLANDDEEEQEGWGDLSSEEAEEEEESDEDDEDDEMEEHESEMDVSD